MAKPDDYPDDRPIFEARQATGKPWVWEVWDVEHPAACNHFSIMVVDSKGAADDFHETWARAAAAALNAEFAASANRWRRAELEAESD